MIESEEWGTLEHDGNTLSGGLTSGSGLLTVAGQAVAWQCGHFEWSDGWDWSIFGGMTVIGDGGRCDEDEGEAEEWGTLEHDGNTLSDGLTSGSGCVAVAGQAVAWQCGHFEWSHDGVWSIFGGMTVIGDRREM
jgi:hypothetical protein